MRVHVPSLYIQMKGRGINTKRKETSVVAILHLPSTIPLSAAILLRSRLVPITAPFIGTDLPVIYGGLSGMEAVARAPFLIAFVSFAAQGEAALDLWRSLNVKCDRTNRSI